MRSARQRHPRRRSTERSFYSAEIRYSDGRTAVDAYARARNKSEATRMLKRDHPNLRYGKVRKVRREDVPIGARRRLR